MSIPSDAHSNAWIDFLFFATRNSFARVVATSGVETT